MTQLGLRSIDGPELEKEWIPGASTYLGMTVSGYPNMFHIYGTHGPTLLSDGPTAVAVQGRWIGDAIAKIEANGIKYINPQRPGRLINGRNMPLSSTTGLSSLRRGLPTWVAASLARFTNQCVTLEGSPLMPSRFERH